jgi:hypothetical protein
MNTSASNRYWLLTTINVGTGSGINGSVININGEFSRVDSSIKLKYTFNGFAGFTPQYEISSEQNFRGITSQIFTYLNTATTPNQIDIYIYSQSFTYASFNLIRNSINYFVFNSVANWSVTAPVVSGTYTLVHDTIVNSILNINTNLKRIGINKPAPAYPLDVSGDLN